MSKREDKRHFLGFAIDMDVPATSKREVNIEIPMGLFKGILLTLFLLSAFMYVLGLRHGLSVQLPPTAVVEVTSEAKGRTDGK